MRVVGGGECLQACTFCSAPADVLLSKLDQSYMHVACMHPKPCTLCPAQADVLLSKLDQSFVELHVDSEHQVAVQKSVQMYMQVCGGGRGAGGPVAGALGAPSGGTGALGGGCSRCRM